MLSRPVRIAIVTVGLLSTAGAGYRAVQDEIALQHAFEDAANAETAADQIAEALLDLRASLHAYVAPGQGLPFWAKRAQTTIDMLRQNLMILDGAVAPFGGSLAKSLDGVDQLGAAERRARTYASRNEFQIAGDVIFTEGRDLLAAATSDTLVARNQLKQELERRSSSIRREQLLISAITLGAWIAIAGLLLLGEPRILVKDPAEWRHELADALKKSATAHDDSGELRRDLADLSAEASAKVEAASDREGGPVPRQPGVALSAVQEVSEICADLSALADPGALEGALARVNTLLDATGLIVWIGSNDGSTLAPVATHGFDPKLVARIGKIARDSANLTAAAFRENTPKMSAPTESTAGALAVAMRSPSGPVGVLSLELKAGQLVDDAKLALATIIAAQLATLATPVASSESEVAHAPVAEARRAAL
jgi:hypothetical protein